MAPHTRVSPPTSPVFSTMITDLPCCPAAIAAARPAPPPPTTTTSALAFDGALAGFCFLLQSAGFAPACVKQSDTAAIIAREVIVAPVTISTLVLWFSTIRCGITSTGERPPAVTMFPSMSFKRVPMPGVSASFVTSTRVIFLPSIVTLTSTSPFIPPMAAVYVPSLTDFPPHETNRNTIAKSAYAAVCKNRDVFI